MDKAEIHVQIGFGVRLIKVNLNAQRNSTWSQ